MCAQFTYIVQGKSEYLLYLNYPLRSHYLRILIRTYPSLNDVVSVSVSCMSVYEKIHQGNNTVFELRLGYNEIKNCP